MKFPRATRQKWPNTNVARIEALYQNEWPGSANSGLMRCRKSLKYPIGTGEHQTRGPCRSRPPWHP